MRKISIVAVREAYGRSEIGNLGLVSSKDIKAQERMKPGVCKVMHRLMLFGTDQLIDEQCVIRIRKGIERLYLDRVRVKKYLKKEFWRNCMYQSFNTSIISNP